MRRENYPNGGMEGEKENVGEGNERLMKGTLT